ncbi:hypothetical protein Hs30E_15610 [Lactococcus hodotermopsidis]|uniref:Accessory Sec system protein Asp2 n=1 Tax=Pseudolactococcus hodotermopsidis TaxID=2709157 RepID=A0A6A0BCB7_9LACT|nr:accessory Sec system protein Asp2 [Lactococcus hodotermopsidis]GFH43010.1 hypothetical protein Hs30E_15610 [Lactococcus hodotermopsidis]
MNYIELNTQQFEKATHMTLTDFLAQPQGADYLILDCRTVTLAEVSNLVDAVRSRWIVYGYATVEQTELLQKWGHFDLTEIWEQANFIEELDWIFDELLFTQGWNLAPDEAAILSDEFTGVIERHGRYELFFEHQADAKELLTTFEPAIKNWMFKALVRPYRRFDKAGKYWLEFDCELDDSMTITYVFTQYDKSENILRKEVFDVREKSVLFEKLAETAGLDVAIFVSGQGKAKIGKVWTYKYKYGLGRFFAGDEKWTAENGERIDSYYIPGKDQRKLIVGFSGALNEVPQYERMSMAKFGFPVLLFADVRSRGGVFQLGRNLDERYEKSLKAIIDEKLAENGLSRNDLIFAGWSMGSFSASYYGVTMEAGHVISCKTLVNVGKITSDTWLIYKMDGAMIDAREYLLGRLDKADDEKLDSLLPNAVRQHDISKTNFYLFMMNDDELDRNVAFYEQVVRPQAKSLIIDKYDGFHAGRVREQNAFIMGHIQKIKDEL